LSEYLASARSKFISPSAYKPTYDSLLAPSAVSAASHQPVIGLLPTSIFEFDFLSKYDTIRGDVSKTILQDPRTTTRRYDMTVCLNVRSKTSKSQVNLPH